MSAQNPKFDESSTEHRRDRLRLIALTLVLILAAVAAVWYVQSSIPRRIVLASGVKDASYHIDAQHYAEILARDGVTVVERMTGGAGENATLLRDPNSGVDVAFMEGGVIARPDQANIKMLASLRFEPVWVFYRGDDNLTRLDELRYKRIAIGPPGNGGRVIVEPLLANSDVTSSNSTLLPLGNRDGLRALQEGRIDAAIMVGAPGSPIIWQALHDDTLKLMSFADAEAYVRLYSYLSRVILPAGAIEMRYRHIPAHDVTLVATKAMLVARESLPPALVALLFEAARDLHEKQGFFEAAQQFPSTAPVDLPVSDDADRHNRFGPSFLQRHLPFWVATFAERLIVVVLPILIVVVPLVNFLPQLVRWRMRSRIYRWYGELKLLERDVEGHTGTLPVDKWLADLDRIERAAEQIRIPPSFANEWYTLREHINFVRRAVSAKIEASGTKGPARTIAVGVHSVA